MGKARKRDAKQQLGVDVFGEVQQLAPQPLAPPGTGAFVELARIRAGHGILFTVDASASHGSTLALDVAGPVFANAAVASLANWVLPLTVFPTSQSPPGQLSFVLGAKKLTHDRVDSELAKMIAAGDPLFVIDLLQLPHPSRSAPDFEPVILRRILTRASLIKSGLINPSQTVVADEPIPSALKDEADARRKPSVVRTALRWCRWWFLPCLFMSLCWTLFLQGDQQWQSAAGWILAPAQQRIHEVLPPVPNTLTQAFALGQLSGTALTDGVLDAAATILGRQAPLTVLEFQGVEHAIQQFEGRTSLWGKVWGSVSFVNTYVLLYSYPCGY